MFRVVRHHLFTGLCRVFAVCFLTALLLVTGLGMADSLQIPADSQEFIEDQLDWLLRSGKQLDRETYGSTRYQFIRGEWAILARHGAPKRLSPSEIDNRSEIDLDSIGLSTMTAVDRVGFAFTPCSLLVVRYERNPSIYPYVSGYSSIILMPDGRKIWNPIRCEWGRWLPEKQEELLKMVFPAAAFAAAHSEADYMRLAKEVVSVLVGVYPAIFISNAHDIQLYSDIVNSETLWWIVENDSAYGRIFSSPFVYDTKPIVELEPKVPSAFDSLAFCFLRGVGPSVRISDDPKGFIEVVLQTWLPLTGNLHEWRLAFSKLGIEKVRHCIIAKRLGIGLGARAFRDEE